MISDDGQPPKQKRVTVTVNVPRDLFPPTINLPDNRTINERTAIGAVVFDTNVGDGDRQVCAATKREGIKEYVCVCVCMHACVPV